MVLDNNHRAALQAGYSKAYIDRLTKPLVINLAGGPGAGKSTLAAGVFTQLKFQGVNCELVTEYAKSKVWEDSLRVLEDQVYILGKQHHELFCLRGKVDVVITDSPLFLSLVYGNGWGEHFDGLVLDLFAGFDNLTYFVNRIKAYQLSGRVHSEVEATEIDELIKTTLAKYDLSFKEVAGKYNSIHTITNDVLKRLANRG